MKVTYTLAWKVVGVQLAPKVGEIKLIDDPGLGLRAVLTLDLDRYTLHGDRAAALAAIVLDLMFSGRPRPDRIEDEIEARVMQIREERRQNLGNAPALVITTEMESEFNLPENGSCRETESFVLCLDVIDKDAIREQLRPVVMAAVNATILSLDAVEALPKVHESVTFERSDGKPVYALTSRLTASVSVLKPFPAGVEEAIARAFRMLREDHRLSRVQDLLCSSLEAREDWLRAFLYAWAVLEILINKLFDVYKSDGQLEKGEYKNSLVRKFEVIASSLAPSDMEGDRKTVKDAKKRRDTFYHAMRVSEDELPVDEALYLARKYLRLHLEATAQQPGERVS